MKIYTCFITIHPLWYNQEKVTNRQVTDESKKYADILPEKRTAFPCWASRRGHQGDPGGNPSGGEMKGGAWNGDPRAGSSFSDCEVWERTPFHYRRLKHKKQVRYNTTISLLDKIQIQHRNQACKKQVNNTTTQFVDGEKVEDKI